MPVLQPGHDSRVLWPSTCLLGQFAPKLPSKEGPVDPRRSILSSFSGVAVVGKFRSRIRLLQFSTRKITPHGNVYISSAIRPIDLIIDFLVSFGGGTNLGIACPREPRGVSPLFRWRSHALVVRVYYLPYHIVPCPCAVAPASSKKLGDPRPGSPAGAGAHGRGAYRLPSSGTCLSSYISIVLILILIYNASHSPSRADFGLVPGC